MASVRVRTCAAGAALAVLAGILVTHGAVFGADFVATALLGVALGAVLGLVPHGNPVLRVAGFGVGFVAAWLGYAVRAGMMPDIPIGRGLVVVGVLSVITAVATATANRVPLWSGLLGTGALVGAYEAGYIASPSDVGSESVVAATSVLLAAAFGFVVSNLIASVPAQAPRRAAAHAADDDVTTVQDDFPFLTDQSDGTTPVPGPRVTPDVPTTSETNR